MDGSTADQLTPAQPAQAPVEGGSFEPAPSNNPAQIPGVIQVGGHTFDLEYRETLGRREVRFPMVGTDGLVAARMLLEDTTTGHGLITRIENTVQGLDAALEPTIEHRATAVQERETAQAGIGAPFEHAGRLTEVKEKVEALARELTGDKGTDDDEMAQKVITDPRQAQDEPRSQREVNREGISKVRETLAQLHTERHSPHQTASPSRTYDHDRDTRRSTRDPGGPRPHY